MAAPQERAAALAWLRQHVRPYTALGGISSAPKATSPGFVAEIFASFTACVNKSQSSPPQPPTEPPKIPCRGFLKQTQGGLGLSQASLANNGLEQEVA